MLLSLLAEVKSRLSACSCSRRKACAQSSPLLAEDMSRKPRLSEPLEEASSTATPAVSLKDLSDEVYSAVLLSLNGHDVVANFAAVGKFTKSVLTDELLWGRFVKQEFPKYKCSDATAILPSASYRTLVMRMQCNHVKWHRLPVQHQLGEREGSPGLFYFGGHVFAFGGWGHGPENDLHAGALSVPLVMRKLQVEGSPVPETYEMKVTLLVDPLADASTPSSSSLPAAELNRDQSTEESMPELTARVAITGGYLRGGYHSESGHYGIIEITIQAGAAPHATWVKTGRMTPRSNHSATFVPPRIAGNLFPEGYLLVCAGNVHGHVSNTLEVLDLKTYQWSSIEAEGDEMEPRNSHSATLVEKSPSTQSPGILILGGGNGDGTNGGPPRGGYECPSAWWLHGLEGANMLSLSRAPQPSSSPESFSGRGHVAYQIAGTDTVVTVGGGRPPNDCPVAFSSGNLRKLELSETRNPAPRAFGGGCALPCGTMLLYGGWHPRGGTFRDFWAAWPHKKAVQKKATDSERFSLPSPNAITLIEDGSEWICMQPGGAEVARVPCTTEYEEICDILAPILGVEADHLALSLSSGEDVRPAKMFAEQPAEQAERAEQAEQTDNDKVLADDAGEDTAQEAPDSSFFAQVLSAVGTVEEDEDQEEESEEDEGQERDFRFLLSQMGGRGRGHPNAELLRMLMAARGRERDSDDDEEGEDDDDDDAEGPGVSLLQEAEYGAGEGIDDSDDDDECDSSDAEGVTVAE